MPETDLQSYVFVLPCKTLSGELLWDCHEASVDPTRARNVFFEAHNAKTNKSYVYCYTEEGFQAAVINNRYLTRMRDTWEEKFPPDEVKDKSFILFHFSF
jgi:hypothetical protein